MCGRRATHDGRLLATARMLSLTARDPCANRNPRALGTLSSLAGITAEIHLRAPRDDLRSTPGEAQRTAGRESGLPAECLTPSKQPCTARQVQFHVARRHHDLFRLRHDSSPRDDPLGRASVHALARASSTPWFEPWSANHARTARASFHVWSAREFREWPASGPRLARVQCREWPASVLRALVRRRPAP